MQIQISFQVVLNTGVGQNLCLKEIYQNSFLDKLHQMKNSEGNLWRLNLSLPESDEAMDFKFKLVKRNLSGKIVEEESITRTTILKKGVRHFDLFWNQQYMNELNGLIGTLNKSELMVVTNDKSSSHSLVMSILKHANDLIPNKQDHLNCRLLKSSSKSSKKSSSKLFYIFYEN